MRFRSYCVLSCAHCGGDIGYVEQYGGRTRKYCSHKCRQRAYQLKKKQDKRYAELQRCTGLLRRWQDYGIEGQIKEKLIAVYYASGREAVELATDAVIMMQRDVRDYLVAKFA